MWISQRLGETAAETPRTQFGKVSIGGEAPAVVTDGELRSMRTVSPKGYFWQPAEGDDVVVAQECLIGRVQPVCGLLPGEIRIENGSAAISLRPDGTVHLSGKIYLNGVRWEAEEA